MVLRRRVTFGAALACMAASMLLSACGADQPAGEAAGSEPTDQSAAIARLEQLPPALDDGPGPGSFRVGVPAVGEVYEIVPCTDLPVDVSSPIDRLHEDGLSTQCIFASRSGERASSGSVEWEAGVLASAGSQRSLGDVTLWDFLDDGGQVLLVSPGSDTAPAPAGDEGVNMVLTPSETETVTFGDTDVQFRRTEAATWEAEWSSPGSSDDQALVYRAFSLSEPALLAEFVRDFAETRR